MNNDSGHSVTSEGRQYAMGYVWVYETNGPAVQVFTMERSFPVDDLMEDLALALRRSEDSLYRAVLDTRKQIYTTEELISFMHIFTPLTTLDRNEQGYRVALVYEDMRPKYAQNAAAFSSNALEAAKRLAQRDQTAQNAALAGINGLLGGMNLYQALNAERLRRQHPIAQDASLKLHVDLDQALDWVRQTETQE